VGRGRYRVPAYEVAENVAALQERGVRFAAGRALLPQRLAHAVLLRMEADGDSPDDRVQSAVARSREVKAYVDQLWPAVKPEQLVFSLFADVDVMAGAADGVLDDDEQLRLLWDAAPKSAGSARWSPADAALVDEVVDLLDRRPSLGHIVLDEAQDLSAMQLRAVGRRCSTGSATVLGDLAQATTPWSVDLLERRAGPSRQAGRGHRGAHPRLPRARRRHRLRRETAPHDRTRADAAALGAAVPRRARAPAGRETRPAGFPRSRPRAPSPVPPRLP